MAALETKQLKMEKKRIIIRGWRSDVRVEEKNREFQDHQETTSRTTTETSGPGPGHHTRGGVEEGELEGGGGGCGEVTSQWLPGMTVSQPDWLASPI